MSSCGCFTAAATVGTDEIVRFDGCPRRADRCNQAIKQRLGAHRLATEFRRTGITRLEDMGIERYLITSSVNGVLAQRLLRTLCEHCKAPVSLSEQTLQQSGIRQFLEPGTNQVFEARGCDQCMHTGYAGRTAIHELFLLDDDIRSVIQSGADASELHIAARRQGMITLYEDGLRKVAAGHSSLEEVLRVTQDQSDPVDDDAVAIDRPQALRA